MIETILALTFGTMIAAVLLSAWLESRGYPPLFERSEPTGAEYEYRDE